MKNFYLLILFSLILSHASNAQSQFYSVPANIIDQYVRDSTHVIGQLDLTFPEDGMAIVQFDGEAYGSPEDRIILAANIYPEWDANAGNVDVRSAFNDEGHCFSHTQLFPVTAGQQSFYAVVTNYVDIQGSGRATVYGRLSVEYFPQSSSVTIANSVQTENFTLTQKLALDSVTIEASGPGKIEVRLNGRAEPIHGDILMIGVSDTKNWSYTDPQNAALEHNDADEFSISFSSTKLVNVDEAGTYTFYTMAQIAYEEEGTGSVYTYTNLHARFYPQTEEHILRQKFIHQQNLILDEQLDLLDSITIDVQNPGKVEIRFDGALRSPFGRSILLAANDDITFGLQEGSVILQTNDDDLDRHPFVHTQVFDVESGSHTFYIMAQSQPGTGSVEVDLNGSFLVKYYPETEVTAVDQLSALTFDIWPNPASDRINIQYEKDNDHMEVSILDLQGHIIRHEANVVSGNELEISTLPSGIYIVEINNGKERGYKKLVKE